MKRSFLQCTLNKDGDVSDAVIYPRGYKPPDGVHVGDKALFFTSHTRNVKLSELTEEKAGELGLQNFEEIITALRNNDKLIENIVSFG